MNEITIEKFRVFVILVNLVVASVALANLATLSTRAIEVNMPEENSAIWSLDIANQRLLIQSEFSVKNNALYDIRDIDVEAQLVMDNETLLMEYREDNMIIPRFSNQSIPIMAELKLDDIPYEELMPLIVMDADFSLRVSVTASYLWGLGGFNMDQTFYFPWESPLKRSIIDHINETGTPGMVSLVEEAVQTGNLDGFYEILNDANLNAVFEIFGVDLSIANVNVTNNALVFIMDMQSGETNLYAKISIPLFDPTAMSITLEGGVGNE